MRRENDIKKFLIISTVTLAVLVLFLIAFLTSKSSRNLNERQFASEISNLETDIDETESASSKIGKSIEDAKSDEKEEFELAEVIENKKEESKESKQKTETSKAENEKKEEKKADEISEENVEFDAPITGEIIREFAKDSLVFSNTLQEWITHFAIDIKADKTTVVKSAANGTVSAIKNDPRYGLTVIIEHDNGFKTVYSNLLTAEFVVKGEKVEKGQSIGTVGNSAAFEIADDCHLHFELLKNNDYLDPTIYINF